MLLENRFTLTYCLWHSESSSTVTLLLHADWMMLKNASNQRGANSVTVLLHRLGTLVAWKDAFLENYLAIIAEQKRYLSVWLRASNERYFSFNWKLVIIKNEKLFAAKFCPETNARFIINCSQLLPPRPYTMELKTDLQLRSFSLLIFPFLLRSH